MVVVEEVEACAGCSCPGWVGVDRLGKGGEDNVVVGGKQAMELGGIARLEPEDSGDNSVGNDTPLESVASEAGSGWNNSPTGVLLVARELGSIPRLLFDEPRVLAELARLGGWDPGVGDTPVLGLDRVFVGYVELLERALELNRSLDRFLFVLGSRYLLAALQSCVLALLSLGRSSGQVVLELVVIGSVLPNERVRRFDAEQLSALVVVLVI